LVAGPACLRLSLYFLLFLQNSALFFADSIPGVTKFYTAGGSLSEQLCKHGLNRLGKACKLSLLGKEVARLWVNQCWAAQ
jgi:hypothetical protein